VQREAKQLKSHTNQNKSTHNKNQSAKQKFIKNNNAKWSPRGEWLTFYAARL